MPALNRDWYNLNCARSWPLDERSSQRSDAGDLLPDDMLVDMRLRFPDSAGAFAFLAGMTVSDKLVSLVICAAASQDSVGDFVPLASFTTGRPVEPWRPYSPTPLLPGVGGWLVFGSGILAAVENPDSGWSGRFSGPAQALLMPKLAIAYRSPPVRGISRLHSELRLTGLVGLSGGNDIEIVRECLEIPGYATPDGQSCDQDSAVVRDVVVFRLVSKETAGEQRNVFDIYRGPCGARPESGTCREPAPIEFIGPVRPDCCGNVVLEFRGCADLSAITAEESVGADDEDLGSSDTCGAILDCSVKISETCGEATRLPDQDGTLPNEYETLCEEEISIVPSPDPDPEPPEDPEIEASVSVDEDDNELSANPDLPFTDDFQTEVGYTSVYGEFGYESDAGDVVYGTVAGAGQEYRNLVYWSGDYEPVYRRAIAVFGMRAGLTGLLHNGAVVFGYREVSGVPVWWQAELDWDGYHAGYQAFRISFHSGPTSVTTLTDQPLSGVRLDEKYRITVTVVPDQADPEQDAWVLAELDSDEDPEFEPVTIGWLKLPGYVADVGHFGMSAYRAITRFHLFSLDNTTDLGGMA